MATQAQKEYYGKKTAEMKANASKLTYTVNIELTNLPDAETAVRLHAAITDFIINELPEGYMPKNVQMNHSVNAK